MVFVHGLWLLPSSWDRWAGVFEEAGYAPLAPGWPDDPETVEEARANPQVLAGKGVLDLNAATDADIAKAVKREEVTRDVAELFQRLTSGSGSRSYEKLLAELRFQERKMDARARSDERKHWRALSKEMRQTPPWSGRK